jgi:uridine phosphorylase
MAVVKWAIGGIAAVVAAGAVVVGTGALNIPGTHASVPCKELSSKRDATAAVATHDDLAKRLQAAGARVTVEQQGECSGDTNYAVVISTPGSAASAVDQIMNGDGFGVFATRQSQ